MMKLFFDTETNGLPDWGQPSEAPQQPHLVQLALIALDDAGRERSAISVLVRPEGWDISEAMTAIHGIGHATASALGLSEATVTNLFLHYLGRADLVIGHNVTFDMRIMRIAMLRAGFSKEEADAKLKGVTQYCTMRAATPLVNAAPTEKMRAAGFTHAKNANLTECMDFFFGEALEGAHDAMVDARACMRVYHAIGAAGG